MSTRCQIGFYEKDNNDLHKPDVLIYRHSDGYPDTPHGVLHTIVPFLQLFNKRREPWEVDYAAAWTLHHLINEHVESTKAWVKAWVKNRKVNMFEYPDGLTCMGFGIDKTFHGDINYYYAVKGTILEVYTVNYVGDNINFELLKSVNL